jgi:hypothetical protein
VKKHTAQGLMFVGICVAIGVAIFIGTVVSGTGSGVANNAAEVAAPENSAFSDLNSPSVSENASTIPDVSTGTTSADLGTQPTTDDMNQPPPQQSAVDQGGQDAQPTDPGSSSNSGTADQ